MDAKADIIWAFNLNGTIADYGEAVELPIANRLNKLDAVHIISLETHERIERATRLITSKTIHSLKVWRGNSSIDLAPIIGTNKDSFLRCSKYQVIRKELCLSLRQSFHSEIYVGGRASLDIMPIRNSGRVIKMLQATGKKVIYFYDCKWAMNDEIHSDLPAAKEAWKAVRTDYKNFLQDFNTCLKQFT